MDINIIFPNQLFRDGELINNSKKTFLIEEFLFFNHFNFHKQKILFHRMSMKKYESFLRSKNIDIEYINSHDDVSDIRVFLEKKKSITSINIYDPEDNWLEKRIISVCSKNNIKINIYENKLFITKKFELDSFFRPDKKKFFQTSFYKSQRSKFNLLMEDGNPEGGKWTYDDLNREKYPKDKVPPIVNYVNKNSDFESAKKYVDDFFENNYGEINSSKIYPYDFKSADDWFESFLMERYASYWFEKIVGISCSSHFASEFRYKPIVEKSQLQSLKNTLKNRFVVILASSHEGEEEMIVTIQSRLKLIIPNIS